MGLTLRISLCAALCTALALVAFTANANAASPNADEQFEAIGARYIDESPAFSPVGATALGDHRFDSQLNQISEEARAASVSFDKEILAALENIDVNELSRANQVDYGMLKHDLERSIWSTETLQEWAWNPLNYSSLAGGAVYGLMKREFAPLDERLSYVADRLEQFPRMYEQVRATLVPARVPPIHAETAVKQNRGVLSILENMVKPNMGVLSESERARLEEAIETAKEAVETHQVWLEEELAPNAQGEFRIGQELYDTKLAYSLHEPLDREDIRELALSEMERVRNQMYDLSCDVYLEKFPYTEFPENPSEEYKQSIIRACLEMAYEDMPPEDKLVETARECLRDTTAFVRERDLVTIPPDPIEIIVMPEFERGVSIAYCDSPGPLDVGQKTFYAVAPLPEDWTDDQILSFLREYNIRSLNDLTVHEAMPGHFLQLAHANRYPGRLRAMLSSGVFIEGWAVYTEVMMSVDQGYYDDCPLQKLITLKWYLRGIGNALIDQSIHVDGMTRDEAMQLMIEGTFQEEREAAAKWVRAQLTSAQLSTYFVGYVEVAKIREVYEAKQGDDFDIKAFHDRLLSYGSPAVHYVRALMFDEEIPRY